MKNNQMYFKASLDSLSIIITLAVVIVVLIPIVRDIRWISGVAASSGIDLGTVIGFIAMILLVVIPWLYRTQGYVLESDKLTISRPIRSIVISYDQIKTVTQLTKDEFRGSIRTFAVGGLFGYYGKYRSPELGSFTMYTTRRDNRILLILNDDKKIVISPDNMEMLTHLNDKLTVS